MRLHIDGIIFSLQRYGGISVYFRELLRRLPSGQVTLTLETPLQQEDMAALHARTQTLVRPARRLERVRTCRPPGDTAVDVFHSSYYRPPRQAGQASVVTVHDFVHERYVPGPKGKMRRWLINRAIQQAQHIICISEATRADLMSFVPLRSGQQVSVIHNGVGDVFRPLDPQEASASEPPFLLFVGQRGGYKNFSLTLSALARLPEMQLYCVGGGPFADSEFTGIPESVRSRVRHLGFVDDPALNSLYNRAQCLVYPSAYEGFGIPVLEAMRAGCPVVSLDCRAVVEVGGGALCVAQDHRDPAALAQAVIRASGPAERARLRELGLTRSQQFSWDRCAQETQAVYRRLHR